MTFVFEGVVGSGSASGITLSDDIPVCTEEESYALVVLAIARFPSGDTHESMFGAPPSTVLTSVSFDDFTPEAPLADLYAKGCYPEWEQFARFDFLAGENVYFRSDIGYEQMLSGIGVWRYTTRAYLAGDIFTLEFQDGPPDALTATVLLFSGVKSAVPPGGTAEVGMLLDPGGQVQWVGTTAQIDDCAGGRAFLVPNIIPSVNQGTFLARPFTGAVFGYAHAYGLRQSVGPSDFVLDEFDPGSPGGAWGSWGGSTMLSSTPTIIFKRPGPVIFSVPCSAQWRMRVTNGLVVTVDMETQWECPGHDVIDPPPGYPPIQYKSFPVATWSVGMAKQSIGPRYNGLLGCDRIINITSDRGITVPPPPGSEEE